MHSKTLWLCHSVQSTAAILNHIAKNANANTICMQANIFASWYNKNNILFLLKNIVWTAGKIMLPDGGFFHIAAFWERVLEYG